MIPGALFLRSSNVNVLICFVIGFFAGIWLFFSGFRLLRRRRLILDTPVSRIRSASMGMVEISGLAVGPYNLIAPISARPCYYYRTLVWEYKQQGKDKEWVRVAGECMYVPFFVDDNTGRLLVDPRGADLDLHCDFKEQFNGSFFSFSGRDIAPGNLNIFMSRHGVVTSNPVKVEEYCIKPKNALFILGTLAENPDIEVGPQPVNDYDAVGSVSSGGFSWSPLFSLSQSFRSQSDSDAGFNERLTLLAASQPQVIRLSAGAAPEKTSEMSQQEKVAAALQRAGISNPAAWSAAGLATATGQVIADTTFSAHGDGQASGAPSGNGFEPHPPVVLKKGENDKTFLISWRSQQEVAKSLGWKCALMIWGGPMLALVSLYFFLAYENLL